MERASELFPGEDYATRVSITGTGRKEYEKLVEDDLAALFEGRAGKGFKDYKGSALRWEGEGVWAFGTRTWTTRIAGFFINDSTRADFVVGGVWKGKSGRGSGRPASGDAVVERVARLKREGVIFVQKEAAAEEENRGSENGQG